MAIYRQADHPEVGEACHQVEARVGALETQDILSVDVASDSIRSVEREVGGYGHD